MEGMPKHASSPSETMNLAGGDDRMHVGGCRGLWESRGYVVFTQPCNNGKPAPVFWLPGKIDLYIFRVPPTCPDDPFHATDISSIIKKEHVRRVTICGMKWADHRGGWMRRWNGAAFPGTRLRVAVRAPACVPSR